MQIIFPSQFRPATGKLGEAEIHFGPEDGMLDGTKLIGFTIWQKRRTGESTPDGESIGVSLKHPTLSMTFPSRPWQSKQGPRTFALLRAQDGSGLSKAEMMRPIWNIRETILDAWVAQSGYQADTDAEFGD